MIDIHTHILPWLDDGARDIDETLEMARIAMDSGVTDIVATPHCNLQGLYENYYGEEYIQVFEQVRNVFKREGITLGLHPGMEVFMTPEVPELLRKQKLLTLNGSHYMLVEFDFEEDPQYVQMMLSQIAEIGVKPVIAHVERYKFVQKDIQLAYEWYQKGYYIQVNKGSLQGGFGESAWRTSHRLLRHGVVSVVASDTHSPYKRTPDMKSAYEKLMETYPEKYLRVLFEENPRRICEDRPTLRFKARLFE